MLRQVHAHPHAGDGRLQHECRSANPCDSGEDGPASALDLRADRELDGTPRIFAGLYRELHRTADRLIRVHGSDLALDPTTLLHETYLDLAQRDLRFDGRPQFFAYAGRAMRGIIVDHVRRRNALKRGAELVLTSLDDNPDAGDIAAPGSVEVTRLNEAIKELASRNASLAELVDLKFFCGFSFTEIATLRAVSERTVQRDWRKARLFLLESLRDC
jgi:RNA polymerase sigma factor (TIGR02999 family)